MARRVILGWKISCHVKPAMDPAMPKDLKEWFLRRHLPNIRPPEPGHSNEAMILFAFARLLSFHSVHRLHRYFLVQRLSVSLRLFALIQTPKVSIVLPNSVVNPSLNRILEFFCIHPRLVFLFSLTVRKKHKDKEQKKNLSKIFPSLFDRFLRPSWGRF